MIHTHDGHIFPSIQKKRDVTGCIKSRLLPMNPN